MPGPSSAGAASGETLAWPHDRKDMRGRYREATNPALRRIAASIALENVGKVYPGRDGRGGRAEPRDPTAGELVTVLIGPSGCGKSTVLRMVNRLIEPSGGRVLIDGVDVLKSRTRSSSAATIGYVIQNVGPLPAPDRAATNVGTVPRMLGWDRKRIRTGAPTSCSTSSASSRRKYAARYPHELSGGQRQRIGVARALAADPLVLLMDEPFSAVDPIARGRLQEEFLNLQATVRKTIVMVTHDIDEAVRLGDRIAVLAEGGRLMQYAPPAQLLSHPDSPTVSDFVGADRGIRRLAVSAVRDAVRPLEAGQSVDGLPTVDVGGTLYDALAVMLTIDATEVAVLDGGRPVGIVPRAAIFDVPNQEAQATV